MNVHIFHLLVSLMVSIVFLFLLAPFLHGKVAFWDIAAARKVAITLRILIICQFILNCILLVLIVRLGSPIILNQVASIGRSSWTYGYGRPLAGGVLITTGGLMADAHLIFRSSGNNFPRQF